MVCSNSYLIILKSNLEDAKKRKKLHKYAKYLRKVYMIPYIDD